MAKRVTLPEKLDTASAPALRDELAAAQTEDVVLDAANVQQFGGLCLEILMSACAIWKRAGRTITIENATPQMTDDLGRFGLTPETLVEYAA